MTAHRHLYGCKGRPPRAGDLCLACPQAWEQRGRNWWSTPEYKPRTRPHQAVKPQRDPDETNVGSV